MSEKVGTIDYGSDDDEVFIGRGDFGHVRTYSDEARASIDEEVKRIIDECYDKESHHPEHRCAGKLHGTS